MQGGRKRGIRKAAGEAKESAERASKTDPYKPAGAKSSDESDKETPEGKSPVSKKPAKASDDTPERGPDGKFLPKEGKAADEGEEGEEKGSSLKNLLKHREKVATEKKAVHTETDRMKRELEDQTRQIQETWRQLQVEQARIQKEKERFERLRRDPAAAIREVGWDPEQFIVDLARDGTPEGAMARQQRELQQEIQEMKRWKEEQARAHQEAQQRQQWEQQVNYRQHIEKTFLSDALNEEARPHAAAFYKGREQALMAYA